MGRCAYNIEHNFYFVKIFRKSVLILKGDMYSAPRLVIQSTVIGAALLAVILFFVSAGFSYPTPVQAAAPVPAQPEGLEPPAQTISEEAALTAAQEQTSAETCAVSARFPEEIRQWCDLITHYARKRGLPPDLIAALIWQESGGRPDAVSHSGAIGLMQVMPSDGAAAEFMCANGPCFADRPASAKLLDPEFNISYGTRLLAAYLARSGDLREALKAYGPMDYGYYYADRVLALYQQYGNP